MEYIVRDTVTKEHFLLTKYTRQGIQNQISKGTFKRRTPKVYQIGEDYLKTV